MQSSSNHTEDNDKVWRRRLKYIEARRPYFDYLLLLLDRASLPVSTTAQPNVTSMAAMLEELRNVNPDAPDLNSIVMGRLLHRVLSPLLTWHGGTYVAQRLPPDILLIMSTTVYRLPEIGRARASFERFVMGGYEWSNDLDQWQVPTRCDEL